MYRAPYGASLIMLWDKFFRCYVGDCVDLMREMPEKAFHTCVTSPPYYALRDYGVEGQIGPSRRRRSLSNDWLKSSVQCVAYSVMTERSG